MLLAVAVVALLRCGPPNLPAGSGCGQTTDCASNLTCESVSSPIGDGGCTQATNLCTRRCQTDTDCTVIGGSYKCQQGCFTYAVCANTSP